MAEMNRPILLTGSHGQVGGQLLPLLQELGDVVAPARAELDLADAAAIRSYVRSVKPRWILNPAAYTAVDKAEQEAELAFAINAEAPRVLGEVAAEIGAPVLHFSTDYVFSGAGTRPWLETDATGPLSVYGASKLAGEEGLARSGAAYVIFRTSWVYGATGANFLRTILRVARERDELRIVADQHGAPTWSHDLARLAAHTLRRMETAAYQGSVSLAEAVRPVSGTYHACNTGATTWFGFAEEFLRLARAAEPEQRFGRLVPITTAEYPMSAARPQNSLLNCDKLVRELGFTMPPWQESTASVMAELYSTRSHS
jgi:dTDP-4-dehydrorhamnose reductase